MENSELTEIHARQYFYHFKTDYPLSVALLARDIRRNDCPDWYIRDRYSALVELAYISGEY